MEEFKNITFSILIPAYKSMFIKECIQSILNQTYTNYEIIVVNDASPENIDSIISEIHDDRVKYFKNKFNCGAVNVVDNWNICLKHASGEYVICMGDDDKLLPNCLEEYYNLINKYPSIGLLHGWTEIINEKSERVMPTTHRCEYESVLSLMWHRIYAYQYQFIGDFCFKKDWLCNNGGFYKMPLGWGSDDISAIIGATKNGVANTQKVVFQYRINSETISNDIRNIDKKLLAINMEYEWKRKFLINIKNNVEDEIYKRQLLEYIGKWRDKKKIYQMSLDLKNNSIFRLFYWFGQRNKYGLSLKFIIYAFILSHKH